jgi:type I restriction enzyme M protein
VKNEELKMKKYDKYKDSRIEWIDESKTKIGYEINFTKYFYEFKPLRSLADIKDEILKLEETIIELKKKVLE